jgi:hypothetical protein
MVDTEKTPGTAPRTEGLFSKDDLKATLDGRIRQLEGELAGNRLQYAETIADPHVDDEQADVFTRNIESLEARLGVVRGERSKLK